MRIVSVACICFLLGTLGCKKPSPGSSTSVSASAPAPAGTSDPPVPSKRATPAAHEFLPAGCDLTFVVNAAAVLSNPFFGKELLLGADPTSTPVAEQTPEQRAFFGFLQDSGLKLADDLGEVAICLFQPPPAELPTPTRFLAAISGNLPDDLIPRLKRALPSADDYQSIDLGGRPGLLRDGRRLVQTASGTLLFSSDEALLKGALKPGTAHQGYELGPVKLISATGSATLLAGLAQPGQDDVAAALTSAKSLRVSVDLNAHSGDVKAHLETRDATSASLAKKAVDGFVAQLVSQSESAPRLLRPQIAPVLALATGASVTTNGAALEVSVQAPPGLIETLVQQAVQLGAPAMGGPKARGQAPQLSTAGTPSAGRLPTALQAPGSPAMGASPPAATAQPSR